MEDFTVYPANFAGKTVEEMAVAEKAVVVKFTDGTYLDVYVNAAGELKTSTNTLDDTGEGQS
ncbi:hypothetical protein [Alkalicoccus urumqiensis]|uniref:Uncharacterized protein n=1 Tax=Alkalicoccus urumqiensis TaxID=1548213 RepID=A0A2P6MLI2_ALKUR|nr:hypothetical protein [Alkalicoccus urumqiensis]PRO67141.1 hypothetical protein C6I21_00820 [Alkalicoccus urumqiensis]